MKTYLEGRWRGVALAAVGALLLACSDSGPTTAPTLGSGDVALSKVPAHPSPNFAYPDPEWVEVCLKNDLMPEVLWVEVLVDKGGNGTIDTVFVRRLERGQCADVWVHGGKTADRVFVHGAPRPKEEIGYVAALNEQGLVKYFPLVEEAKTRGFGVSGKLGWLIMFEGYENYEQ